MSASGNKQFEIIRSNRKTCGIQINPDGSVTVRAPYRMPRQDIVELINKKADWINTAKAKVAQRRDECEKIQLEARSAPITYEEIRELADMALKVLSEKVKMFAPVIGVTYSGITVRNQTSRWGSCSSAGRLNFNCLLMLAPDEVQDYVVVHELCHRKEMNHSKRFWHEVARVMPDYALRQNWLKLNGTILIERMKAGSH